MTVRSEVYAAIDSERDYQDRVWGKLKSSDEPGHGERTVDEFAIYLQAYQNDLARLATHSHPPEKLACIRKIAGLCVACMEQHGAPRRT